MFNVSDYFKRLTTMEEGAISLNGAVLRSFREVCGIEKVDFMVRKGVVVITSHSIIKSVVFMKKREVLEHLSRTSPSSKITDIR
jgi:hypothetical protein